MNKALARLKKIKESITALVPAEWSDPDLVEALVEVFADEQRLAALRLSIVNELVARKIPTRQGATSGAAWFGGLLRISHYAAGKMVRLAKALSFAAPDTRAALAAGGINVDQAEAIAQAVNRLPEARRQQGETRMLGLTAELDSAQLRRAGVDLQDQVDPDGARQRHNERVMALARRTDAMRGIYLSPMDGDQMVNIRGRMEQATADIVRAALDPARVPNAAGRPSGTALSAVDPRTPGARRLDTLKDLCVRALAQEAGSNALAISPDSRRRTAGEPARTGSRRSRRQKRNQAKKRAPVGMQRPDRTRGGQGSAA